MNPMLSTLIYLLAGSAIVYLFQVRRKQLSLLGQNNLPGMDEEGIRELRTLLKTAHERTLYMGVAFFPLAFTTYQEGATVSKIFFAALIFLLFLSNISPRNRIMRLLDRYGLSIEDLRQQGIRV